MNVSHKWWVMLVCVNILVAGLVLHLVAGLATEEKRSIEYMIGAKLENSEQVLSNKNVIDTQVIVDEMRDLDIKRGLCSVAMYVKMRYDGKKISKPDFIFGGGNIIQKFPVSVKRDAQGMTEEMVYLRTLIFFEPTCITYPVDYQCIKFDFQDKAVENRAIFAVSKVSYTPDIYIGTYNMIETGGRLIAHPIIGAENNDNVFGRGYLVIGNGDFIKYIKSYYLLIISIILANVSFAAQKPNIKYGAMICSIMMAVSNAIGLFSRMKESLDLTFLDVSTAYYIAIFATIFIIVAFSMRRQKKADVQDIVGIGLLYNHYYATLAEVLLQGCGNSNPELEAKMKEIKDGQEKGKNKCWGKRDAIEAVLAKWDKAMLISMNILFWFFLIGAFFMLQLTF